VAHLVVLIVDAADEEGTTKFLFDSSKKCSCCFYLDDRPNSPSPSNLNAINANHDDDDDDHHHSNENIAT
jgi:hypothetical protein